MFKKLLNFVFPRFCSHCQCDLAEIKSSIFCTSCQELLQLSDLKPVDLNYFPKGHVSCLWEYIGPAENLVKQLKYNGMPYLSKGAAAMMAAKFLQLKWPFPDLIVPVPQTLPSKVVRKYNQSVLLSKELAKILNCKYKNILQKDWQSSPQTGLSNVQRKKCNQNIKVKNHKLCDKPVILLIDDVITTGATLNACAKAILEKHNATLYAIALCN